MFTGIVADSGRVKGINRKADDALLSVSTAMDLQDVRLGDSIAVNGACLTVTQKGEGYFGADVSAETLSLTNLATLKVGDRVNVEKALRMSDFLGGHLVLGHVDGQGVIREKTSRSGSIVFGIEVSEGLGRYIVAKGSITVDGISLTVNRYEKKRFYVNVIPHTAQQTTLDLRKIGDRVNIETDIIGKYVEKLLQSPKGIDAAFLEKYGYMKE